MCVRVLSSSQLLRVQTVPTAYIFFHSLLGQLIQNSTCHAATLTLMYLTKQMLKLIAKFVGKPRDDSELAFVTNPKAQKFMEDLPEYPPADLRRRFPSAGADAVDLLARMLVMRPDRRLSVDEALRHPYLRSLRDKKVMNLCHLVQQNLMKFVKYHCSLLAIVTRS